MTTGNGHDGPTDEEKERIKKRVMEEWDKQQEEKKKQEGK